MPLIDPSSSVPPHIALLLNEKFPDDGAAAFKRLKSMAKDLRDQAELAPRSMNEYAETPHEEGFRIVMSGGLDLFSRGGFCRHLKCRLGYVDKIARSVVLMADDVSLHDHFGSRLMEPNAFKGQSLIELFEELILLRQLRPLIEAGLVSFRPTMIGMCSGCTGKFESEIEKISRQVFEGYRDAFQLDVTEGKPAIVASTALYDPPVTIRLGRGYKKRGVDQIVFDLIRTAVSTTLWDARDASLAGGAVFSNSQIGLSGLLEADHLFPGRERLRAMDGQRVTELPFVSRLSIKQAIQLRQDASSALPRLREFLAKNLSAAKKVGASAPAIEAEYVAELREQAAEVKAELKVIGRKQKAFRRNSIGLMGLGIAAYSLASAPLGAAAGLMGTLGLLHSTAGKDEDVVESLKAKPGYVLVAAEKLLGHSASNKKVEFI